MAKVRKQDLQNFSNEYDQIAKQVIATLAANKMKLLSVILKHEFRGTPESILKGLSKDKITSVLKDLIEEFESESLLQEAKDILKEQ